MAATASGVLAFDLGGTRLKAGIVVGGAVVDRDTRAVPPDFAGAWQVLLETGLRLAASHAFDAVGLCVPGIVEHGRIISLPGKLAGSVGIDLGERLGETWERPVRVCNDAIAYGVGEATEGAGRGASRVVVVTIGTGVGVCVVEQGQPLGGGPWGGGILGGQIPIGLSGDGRDTSGREGTIEAGCAAVRLLDLARAAGSGHDSIEALYRAHAAGDASAAAAVDAYRLTLARALVALAHAHTPQRIVLGGGPMTRDNPVFPGLIEAIAPQLWSGYGVELALAEMGDAAALVGLARLSRGLRRAD